MNNNYCVFLGYQFESGYYDTSSIDYVISAAVKKASTDFKKKSSLTLSFLPVDVTPGRMLIDEIRRQIKQSDICVFEISDLNSNVLYEIGLAHGLGKLTILLVNNNSEAMDEISDLKGIVYIPYSKIEEVGSELGKRILDYYSNMVGLESDKQENILRQIWLGSNTDSVAFITGGIRNIKGQNEVDGFVNYITNGDAKALLDSVINILVLENSITFDVTTSDAVSSDQDSLLGNIISIGGPKANQITKNFLGKKTLPWTYQYKAGENYKSKSIYNSETKESLTTVFNSNGEVITDYGMIFVGQNPFNPTKNCILLTGLYTFSVLGSVKSISLRSDTDIIQRNTELIKKSGWSKGKLLQIIVETHLINGQVMTPIIQEKYIEVIEE